MKRRIRYLLMLIAVASALSAWRITYAGDEPVRVTFDPLPPLVSGEPFTVSGSLHRLTESGSEGIAHRQVKLFIETVSTTNGEKPPTYLYAVVHSSETGLLKWTVHKKLQAGHYRLYFVYQGSNRYTPNQAVVDVFVTAKTIAKPVTVTPYFITKLNVTSNVTTMTAGDVLTVTARLTNRMSTPIANQNLRFKLVDVVAQKQTDKDGTVIFTIKKPLAPGNHIAEVEFIGARNFAPIKQSINVVVNEPIRSHLSFLRQSKSNHYVGDTRSFVARLTANEKPLSQQFVRFYIDGVKHHGARTDENGDAILRLPHDLVAGTHTISVTFQGTPRLLSSNDRLSLNILPKPFLFQTVPPLPNVKIGIGNQIITTDDNGIARYFSSTSNELQVRVLPFESTDPTLRAKFIRWSDNVSTPQRSINVANGKQYQIGFELSRRVTMTFIEQDSQRTVDASRVNELSMVNSGGETMSQAGGAARWLKSNGLTRVGNTLVSTPLIYHVQSVNVDGTNVVNDGQQRFDAASDSNWRIRLHLYDVNVVTRDALFGFRVGNGVRITNAKGLSRSISFKPSGSTRIESLSRGDYVLTVQGAQGIAAPTPVTLSRTHDVSVAVISYLDIAVVGILGIALAVATLLIGRTNLIPFILERVRSRPTLKRVMDE